MALTIIFGAGASHDSCGNPAFRGVAKREIRPPLTNQLFDEAIFHNQVLAHQNCVALITRLRSIVGDPKRSVENALEEMAHEATQFDHIARQLFALRYYIQAVIQHCTQEWHIATAGATNYVSLLDRLEVWRRPRGERVNLITFNYDTLLDNACRSVLGMQLNYVDDYVADARYSLLKVHGSIDWYRDVIKPQKKAAVDCLGEVQWTDRYSPTTLPRPNENNVEMIPAIAVPTTTKAGFECPPSQWEELDRALVATTKLIVIGWRGAENHFLDKWASLRGSRPDSALIVTGSAQGADIVESNLRRAGIDLRTRTECTEGFSKFLDTRQLEEFLT